MKCALLVGLLVASLAIIVLPAGSVSADPPDILRNYEFIPNVSTLHQTGGLADVDYWMPITGGFGLVTGWDYEFFPPQLDRFAQFVDVNAVAHHPIHDFPLPIDDLLNLSGLEGTFDATIPNHLFFEGVDGLGAPMHVRAQLYGRLMLLSGSNDPSCCDFFKYEINGVALQTPFADFDSNSRVDGDDFLIWQENFGQHHPAILGVPGDANGDNIVDGRDFLIWQHEYGTDLNGVPAASVPEPAANLLMLLGIVFVVALRRR